MKCKLQHLQVLIIAEIYTVGSQTLINIHKRLKEIRDKEDEDVPFVGAYISAVRDLLQLPPVLASSKNPLHRLSLFYWENHFEYIEVIEVQRQRGDPLFADNLNRVREGNQTAEYISVLSSRIPDHLINCMHIFPTNQQVHDFNEQKQLNEFSLTSTITVQSYNQFNA